MSLANNGMARIEMQSFDAYNESDVLISAIKRHYERTGYYPERILADNIYRNCKNLAYCKEHGLRLSGPALGPTEENPTAERKLIYADAVGRIEIERGFSLTKRCYAWD